MIFKFINNISRISIYSGTSKYDYIFHFSSSLMLMLGSTTTANS
jgi:hypothetical protein